MITIKTASSVYWNTITILSKPLKRKDFDLISFVFNHTNRSSRCWDIAYMIENKIKNEIPQIEVVWGIRKSETVPNIVSGIKKAIVMTITSVACLLLIEGKSIVLRLTIRAQPSTRDYKDTIHM